MLDFLNSDYVGGFVTALTLFGFAIAAFRWKKQRASKISFTSKSAPIFVGTAPNGYRASVNGNGQTGDSLFRSIILLSNRTQMTVTDEDFVGTPFIARKENGVLFDIRSIKGFNGSAHPPTILTDRIEFSGLRIPVNEAIAFEILHDGSVIESLEALPKSLPTVRKRNLSKSDGLDNIVLFLLTMGLFVSSDVPNRMASSLGLFGLFAFLFLFLSLLRCLFSSHLGSTRPDCPPSYFIGFGDTQYLKQSSPR